MRNNINAQMIEQFINGPESPLKIQHEIEKITESICKAENTSGMFQSIQLKASIKVLKNIKIKKKLLLSSNSKNEIIRSLSQENYLPSMS